MLSEKFPFVRPIVGLCKYGHILLTVSIVEKTPLTICE